MKITSKEHKVARGLSYLTGVIFVALPFHALLTTWAGSNTGHLDLLRIWKEILIVAMVAPAAWLALKTPAAGQWLKHSWLPRLIALYALVQICLGLWALQVHHANKVALIYALIINLRFLGFFLICTVLSISLKWLYEHWVNLVLWPAAGVILFGLIQRLILPYDFLRHFGYGPKTIPAYQTVDSNIDYRRIQSSLRGANPLGAYLALVLPTVAVANLRRWLKYVFMAGGLAVLFFSYSRSAWIGSVLALGFLAWQIGEKKFRIHKLLIVTAIITAALAIGLYEFGSIQGVQDTLLHTSSKSTSSVSSNAARSAAMKQAAKEVWHQPLGDGPGTAGPASFRNNAPRIAENYYLQIGQEVGIAGMFIFGLIVVLVAVELWRLKADSLALVLLASLIGISFINLVSHAWTDDTLSLLWWGLAGVAIGAGILKKRTKSENGRI